METKETLLERIREKVCLAVPSIKDLVFGCRVLVETKKMGLQQTVITGFMSAGGFDTWSFGAKSEKQIKKIIGREIYLHDILYTIGNLLVVIDCAGNFYQLEMKLSDKLPKFGKPTNAKWSLKEPLHNQSLPTLVFINSLV